MDLYSKEEIEGIFDRLIEETGKGLQANEVPIVACMVDSPGSAKDVLQRTNMKEQCLKIESVKISKRNFRLIEMNHNLTNISGNATQHSEIIAINRISEYNNSNAPLNFKSNTYCYLVCILIV